MNYWPVLTRTVAKSLTEWWGCILVLSPLRESQLSYGVIASILARSATECRHRGTFGTLLLVFFLLRGVLSNEALLGLVSMDRGRDGLSAPQKVGKDIRKCIIDGQPVSVTVVAVKRG